MTGGSEASAAPVARPWGYWATAAWAVVAFLAGQFVALGFVLWWRAGQIYSILETPYDGPLVTLFIFISNPVTIAVLALVAWLKRGKAWDYLGLQTPNLRDLAIGIFWLIVLIALSDGLLYFGDRDLVTTFQLQSYTTAAAEGWLPALMVAAILVAPAGEEVLFRGFLFAGFVRSKRSAWAGIVFISILWAVLHIQYDWAGVLQIFVIGLFLGWMRWRSGSTVLTFVLHALFNLEGTLETVLYIRQLA